MICVRSANAGRLRHIHVISPEGLQADHITEIRAKARATHGWIMDTYLLRRS